MTKIVKQYKER